MTGSTPNRKPTGSPLRIAAWTAPFVLLLIPLVGTQVSDEVQWSLADFLIATGLILAVGIPLDIVLRNVGEARYRWAAGIALLAAFLLLWINGAVGIIGSEDNDVNLLYGGVLAIGVIGTLVARFRPQGMAYAMTATALAQTAVTIGALVAGLGASGGGVEIVVINGFFVALWAASAVLFREASHRPSAPDDVVPPR